MHLFLAQRFVIQPNLVKTVFCESADDLGVFLDQLNNIASEVSVTEIRFQALFDL